MVEIYESGGFPKLVLESKKAYASRYGLASDYWQHFDPANSPEVIVGLKATLGDLATHYHAVYQEPERAEPRPESFAEAQQWYRAYLASFPEDPEPPGGLGSERNESRSICDPSFCRLRTLARLL